MDLPLDFCLDSISEKEFGVIYFKDKELSEDAPPHNHVIVPINKDWCFMLCMITSQVEKKKKYYAHNPKALSSLIEVGPSNFPFLDRNSLINCNEIKLINKNKLAEIIDGSVNFEIRARDGDFAEDLKTKIIDGIKNSPLTKPYYADSLLSQ
jgi:hypothetical protein